MKTWTALVTAFSCVILVGCGAEPSEDGDEIVGEAVLGVGEQSCAEDATADDEVNGPYCSNQISISANGSYGQTDCPGQYVVEFDGTLVNIAGFADGWGDTLPSSEAQCELAHSYVTAWQLVGTTWSALGSTSHVTGSWSGGACSFPDPTGWDSVDINADLVRVASRAYQCSNLLCTTPTVKKAQAYVYGTPCE